MTMSREKAELVIECGFHLMAPDSNSPTQPSPQEGRVLPGETELVRLGEAPSPSIVDELCQ